MENLEEVLTFINTKRLIEKGDRVGVAVSGGGDSMALLHFLVSNQKQLGCTIIAVNVNHNMRAGSRKDSKFVADYCKANGIEFAGYNIDVPPFAAEQKMSLEQAARVKRYQCFDAAIQKFGLTKFAVAHHASDQAETILLHIFRGSGIAGASGMQAQRGIFVRPFLETAKTDIVAYLYKNQIPFVEDETNADTKYPRNFLRHEVIPLLKREWRNVEKNVNSFGTAARIDNEYLSSLVERSHLIRSENNIRIPLNFFAYPDAVVARIVLTAFEEIGMRENIEKKHVDLILILADTGENGSRIDLPNGLYAIKEYEYITIVKKGEVVKIASAPFKIGKTAFPGFEKCSMKYSAKESEKRISSL